MGGKGHKTKNDQSKKSQLSLVNLKKKKIDLSYYTQNIILSLYMHMRIPANACDICSLLHAAREQKTKM